MINLMQLGNCKFFTNTNVKIFNFFIKKPEIVKKLYVCLMAKIFQQSPVRQKSTEEYPYFKKRKKYKIS